MAGTLKTGWDLLNGWAAPVAEKIERAKARRQKRHTALRARCAASLPDEYQI